MTAPHVLERAHASLIATFTRVIRSAGGLVRRDADQFCYASRSDDPIFWNGVIAAEPPHDPAGFVARAVDFFRPLDRRATMWTLGGVNAELESYLGTTGHQNLGDSPQMVLSEMVDERIVAGLTVRRVRDEHGRRQLVDVLAGSFLELGASPSAWELAYPTVADVARDDVYAVLGTSNGAAVGAALACLHDGVAEIVHVGTLPSARGRGVGEALTRAVSRAAYDRGADLISLQASALGEPVYRRIGFTTIGRYRWYLLNTS